MTLVNLIELHWAPGLKEHNTENTQNLHNTQNHMQCTAVDRYNNGY